MLGVLAVPSRLLLTRTPTVALASSLRVFKRLPVLLWLHSGARQQRPCTLALADGGKHAVLWLCTSSIACA